MIQKERDGDMIDTELLKNVVGIYQYLSNEKIIGQGVDCLLDLENKIVEESTKFF